MNTGSVIVFNAIVAYTLILRFGVVGAAWARLAAEVFGFAGAVILTRWAFPVPLQFGRMARVVAVAVTMAIVVGVLDRTFVTGDMVAMAILIPVGTAIYLLLCWLLDVASARVHLAQCLLAVRNLLTQLWRNRY